MTKSVFPFPSCTREATPELLEQWRKSRLAHAADIAQGLLDGAEHYRNALIRIGGLDANGLQGFHNVGDEEAPDECPGCWAWWGLFGTVRPTQEELDGLRRNEW